MNLRKLFLGAATLVLLTALYWQHTVRASLQETNQSLLGRLSETEQEPSRSREPFSTDGLTNETADLANSELLKLRQEIRNVRIEHQQIDLLKAENQRLRTELSAGATGRRFSEAEGYLSSETWRNVGFTTPEAAVQTFFQALHQQSYPQAFASFTQKEQRNLYSEFIDPNGNLDGQKIATAFQPLIQVSGFRFAKVETVNDSARVGIQSLRGGVIFEMSLQREGDEWKIKGF